MAAVNEDPLRRALAWLRLEALFVMREFMACEK